MSKEPLRPRQNHTPTAIPGGPEQNRLKRNLSVGLQRWHSGHVTNLGSGSDSFSQPVKGLKGGENLKRGR